jgi:pimeloyl-ACP methyl ester carboxylesterase/class 3 adenylate cyclase
MMQRETRYAKTVDGVHIAYQVIGDGPVDIVVAIGWVTNIDAMWEEPSLAKFLTRLSSFGRLLLFDKRGVGLSDRVPESQLPTQEMRMDDIRAVMDAAGSDRAVIFGISEGGPVSMLFAATYPERSLALVVFGTSALFDLEVDQEYIEDVENSWGTIELAQKQLREWAAPSSVDDTRLARWLASYMQRSASPAAAIALERMNRGLDVRSALPAIHVPTLVIGRTDDSDFTIDDVRAIADAIPGAQMVELSGVDHFFFVGDQDSILDAIERFVGGVRAEEAEFDRVLATVLFTDIVDSTAMSATSGDRAWNEVREGHDRLVRASLARFRGREIKTMGDGFLATFDGPARGIRCARSIVDGVRPLGIEVRAGLHTGEVSFQGDDVAGIGVAIGARVGAKAEPSEVLVSQTVKDLVAGSGIRFEDRGLHALKGVPDEWRLYAVSAD